MAEIKVLSDKEINKYLDTANPNRIRLATTKLLEAQLQQTLRDVIEWGEELCPHCANIPADRLWCDILKRDCPECWQELKQMAGKE